MSTENVKAKPKTTAPRAPRSLPVARGFPLGRVDDIVAFTARWGLVLALLAMVVYFSLSNDRFLSVDTARDLLRAISIVTLIAVGVTFSLVVGGFDLSVGSTAGLAVVLATGMMVYHAYATPVAIVVPLIAGALVGLVNAFLIVRLRIPGILATLGMLYLIQGVQLTYSHGVAIYNGVSLPDGTTAPGTIQSSFLSIGQGNVGGIPTPVIIMVFALVAAHVFMRYTKYGRLLHATGGNYEASRLAGVPVRRYVTLAYVLSGVFAAAGGVILAARTGVGDVLAGSPFLLDAVAAAFIGFAAFGAGKPNVFGTFIGAVFMGVMLIGMTMENVSYYRQDLFKGLVLIGALALSFYLRQQRVAK